MQLQPAGVKDEAHGICRWGGPEGGFFGACKATASQPVARGTRTEVGDVRQSYDPLGNAYACALLAFAGRRRVIGVIALLPAQVFPGAIPPQAEGK